MKTITLAAIAALFTSTASFADDFDRNVLTTNVTTKNLEFSLSTAVDNEFNGFGDSYIFGVTATVLTYDMGEGTSNIKLHGEMGEVNEDEFGTLGATYVWTRNGNGNSLELAGDASYVMFDDFDNGEFILTPSVELTVDVFKSVDVFAGAGYSWNATDEFNNLGGYAELGLDVTLTDNISVRPSVIRTFDTGVDSTQAAAELTFSF